MATLIIILFFVLLLKAKDFWELRRGPDVWREASSVPSNPMTSIGDQEMTQRSAHVSPQENGRNETTTELVRLRRPPRFEGRFHIQPVGDDGVYDEDYNATITGSSAFVARSMYAMADTFWQDVTPKKDEGQD